MRLLDKSSEKLNYRQVIFLFFLKPDMLGSICGLWGDGVPVLPNLSLLVPTREIQTFICFLSSSVSLICLLIMTFLKICQHHRNNISVENHTVHGALFCVIYQQHNCQPSMDSQILLLMFATEWKNKLHIYILLR